MILATDKPYTIQEIEQIKEEFKVYIKTVIDINKRICISGMSVHADGEQMLLEQGSQQTHLWGGGIDTESKEIDFNSFINIRPNDNNPKNEIQSEAIKKTYKELTEYFFKAIL